MKKLLLFIVIIIFCLSVYGGPGSGGPTSPIVGDLLPDGSGGLTTNNKSLLLGPPLTSAPSTAPSVGAMVLCDGVTWNPVGVGTGIGPYLVKWTGSTWVKANTQNAYVVIAAADSVQGAVRADYVCDGTADQVEINAALNYNLGGGGFDDTGKTVMLLPGNYYINDSIVLRDATRLEGSGVRATIINVADSADCDAIIYNPTDSGILTGRWFFSGIFDLKIFGNRDNNTTGHGIHTWRTSSPDLGQPSDFYIERVFVHKMAEKGFLLQNTWGFHLHQLISETNGSVGFEFTGSQAHISGLFIAYNDSHGINIPTMEYTNVTDVFSYQNAYQGIISTSEAGIIHNNFSNIIARENGKSAGGQCGIYLKAMYCNFNNVQAIDKQGTPTQAYGIYVSDTTDCVFSNVYANGNTTSDIYLTANANDTKFQTTKYTSKSDSGVRTVFDGVGYNGSNDPSSAGNWYTNGYEGVTVEWDNGSGADRLSVYADGEWKNFYSE